MTEDNGHYRAFEDIKFQKATLDLIGVANVIIQDYEQRGYSLTLRQLYYQFVSRNLLPNRQQSYDRLGKIISNGRLAGLISWTAIEDRGRNLRGLQTYSHPAQAVEAARDGYRRSLWDDQQWRPEVWVEKEALVGVVGGICNKMRVDFFACKGYNSQSEQWRAGARFAEYIRKGQRPIVFHLGDHDPSGIDMTRDNRDRLSMFAGVPINVQRIALNMDQIEEINPPPNPAKSNDSRFEAYQLEHGDSSWELDALDPDYIAALIKKNIETICDKDVWDASLLREVEEKDQISYAIETLED